MRGHTNRQSLNIGGDDDDDNDDFIYGTRKQYLPICDLELKKERESGHVLGERKVCLYYYTFSRVITITVMICENVQFNERIPTFGRCLIAIFMITKR
jgi:hypothetical protein